MMITFKRPDGKECSGFYVEPSSGNRAPAMVVIQEWWGLNDQIKNLTKRLAQAGNLMALSPDLYRGKVAQDAREAGGRVGADRDRDLKLPFPVLAASAAEVFGAVLLGLPVHAGRSLVKHLHAIATDVALAGVGILRDNHGPGDVTPAIVRPALQNRKIEQRKVFVQDDFLAGTA